jgi:hypothetical protein
MGFGVFDATVVVAAWDGRTFQRTPLSPRGSHCQSTGMSTNAVAYDHAIILMVCLSLPDQSRGTRDPNLHRWFMPTPKPSDRHTQKSRYSGRATGARRLSSTSLSHDSCRWRNESATRYVPSRRRAGRPLEQPTTAPCPPPSQGPVLHADPLTQEHGRLLASARQWERCRTMSMGLLEGFRVHHFVA